MIRVRLANADIQNFLAANIANVATDLDNDGIPDAADNCAPQLRCPNNPADCSNPDQGDLDNDGVGDVCDNCDPRDPKLCSTPASCTNPQQNNNDGDQYGDICDPFPGCATNDLLTCAGCSASEEKAFCNFATGGAGGCNNLTRYTALCFPGTCPPAGPGQACLMDGANGRCRLPADADQDGLTDACDRCPNFQNSNPEQPNDNFHAEIAEASTALPGEVFSLPNVCDPVPIAILDSNIAQATQKINSSGSGLPVSPSDDVLEQQRRSWQFSTRTNLGRLLDTDPNRTFPGTQQFRGCQCDESDPNDCVSMQGTCTTLNPTPLTNWESITVRNDLGVNLGPSSTAPASFSNQPNPNAFSFWYWDWWQDRQNNVFTLPLLTASEGLDKKFPYMHGAILAQTDANNVSDRLTGRPREDNYNLRRAYIELDVGRVVEEHPNILPPSVIGDPCKFGPNCVTWFNWRKEIYSNPLTLPDDFLALSFPENGVLFGIANGVKVRIPGLDDLAQSLTPGNVVLAHAAESPKRRRANGDFREFAILPREFTRQGTNPQMARLSSKGLQLEGRRGGTAPFSLEEETPQVEAQTTEIPVENYRALLSTTLESIFVAGGKNGLHRNQQIWQYDLEQRTWKTAIHRASPAPTGDVASMALDVSRRWLYVLFQSDQRWWQLVRYDLRNDTAKTLATWPDLKVFRGRYLNVLEDGTLVLTGSRDHSHQIFAFEVSANGLKPLGVRAGAQAIPFPPQLGSNGLLLPLLDNKNRLTYETIQRSSFKPGAPCGAL